MASEAEQRRLAIDLAEKLYALLTSEENESVWKDTTPESRHKFFIEKYKDFAEAFPVVLRLMARDIKYSTRAFNQYFDNRLKKRESRKGMEGFMEDQADYAMFLYLDECRVHRKHPDMKKAAKIRQAEIHVMRKWHKKLRKDEKESKNEYEEEEKEHLAQRRAELLDFINEQEQKGTSFTLDEKDDIKEPIETSPEESVSLTDIKSEDLTAEELPIIYRMLQEYYLELINNLSKANETIHYLEEEAEQNKDEWLVGTCLEKKAPKDQATMTGSGRRKNKSRK